MEMTETTPSTTPTDDFPFNGEELALILEAAHYAFTRDIHGASKYLTITTLQAGKLLEKLTLHISPDDPPMYHVFTGGDYAGFVSLQGLENITLLSCRSDYISVWRNEPIVGLVRIADRFPDVDWFVYEENGNDTRLAAFAERQNKANHEEDA